MNDMTTKNDQLPADFGDSLMQGIDNTRAGLRVGGGGKPFMRLLKSGNYFFGQQDDPMQEGSRWAVNLSTLSRGWVCWGKGAQQGKLLGQIMASIQAPKPVQPPPVDGHPFVEQFGMELVCLDGEDAGQEVLYKNHSYGFTKAWDTLLADIRARHAVEKEYFWPILVLSSESYKHSMHGQIFNPIFNVVAWANANGEIAGGKPAAPRKAAPKPALKAVETPAEVADVVEPASTVRAHVGQRRRPAGR